MSFTNNTKPNGIKISYGKGCFFFDIQGKKYLDFCSQTLNLSLGHCHPVVVSAVEESIKKTTFLSSRFENEYINDLVKLIFNIAPKGLNRANLKVTSGTLANEGALKASYKKRKCDGVISMMGSHHGHSLATMRVSGKNFNRTYINRQGTYFFNPCRCNSHSLDGDNLTCHNDCTKDICNLIEEKHEQIAAMIIEPIMVDAGVIIPTFEFMKKIREYTSKYGIILIFDEVQTAFGWTGKMFASDYFSIVPDIITASKGFAAGFPLALMLLKEELDVLNYGEHEITHGGNPIACAVALANLNFIIETNLLKKVEINGQYLLERLSALRNKYSFIQNVRGVGMICAIEITTSSLAREIYKKCLKRGLLLRLSNVGEETNNLLFKPPLITTREIIAEAIDIFEKEIKRIVR